MQRICFVLQVKPERLEEYKERHRRVWPDMQAALRETGWLLGAGLVAGGALSAAAIQLITSRLYGLSPGDPITFGIAVIGLALVALIATWLPAWRASRVDPLVALRCE